LHPAGGVPVPLDHMKALLVLVFAAVALSQTASNVRVDLYMESYCPGCESYTATEVGPARASVGEIMDFMVWPYGNAQEKINCSRMAIHLPTWS